MLKRRDLLFGLALAPLAPARPAECDLANLCRQFHHLRFCCDALEVEKERHWQAWSDTIDQAEDLADIILETPARTTRDLALKYDILLWQLFHDEPEDDRLRSFGAELAAIRTCSQP